MKNVSEKFVENKNTHFTFYKFFPKIVPFMRKREKKIVESDKPKITIWRTHIRPVAQSV
jgi:hypothetical protein